MTDITRTTHEHSHHADGSDGSPFPNTHVLMHEFEYVRAASLQEAVGVLTERPNSKALAGGTNLLVELKMANAHELANAPTTLVDISGVPGLRGIEKTSAGVRIGALTTIRELALSEILRADYTALAEAAAAFGSTQVMMMGTLAGNIANGSPASDTVPALVVLGAQVEIIGPSGTRTALVADLLVGPGRIALQPGELITSILLPGATPQSGVAVGTAFLKLARVRADLAKVSVAVRLVREGGRIGNTRVALGSVGPTVVRAKKASSMLSDNPFSKDVVLNASRMAGDEIKPIDDVRSTAAYRKRAAVALVHDAILLAWDRAADTKQSGVLEKSPTPRSLSADAEEAVLQEQRPLMLAAGDTAMITLTVNGETLELEVTSNELLLNVLRERLELTGAKYGCGIGECGACTVWLNGSPVLGCLVLAVSADGGDVRTVEGLAAPDGTLDPLQDAFIEENAFQCGYCTPGMLMMTKKLMEEIPAPTENDVRDYLKGNACRCTGYASIVRAVNAATKRNGGEQA
ncbi:FAD binding domain-containing protein [Candidatus Bipolaricaulota bacterium]|nr:FAD binding domain-containing protein [Candidatus Bipolaricaulota bacterium]